MAVQQDTLVANGVALNTLAYNTTTIAATLRVPGRRGGNIVVPGRHGELRTGRKPFGTGEIVLPMWVVGSEPNGAIPPAWSDAATKFYANIDTLGRLFTADTITLDHTLPDLTVRRAECEVIDVIDFSSPQTPKPVGKFSVALRVPGAFWKDTTDVTSSFTATSTAADKTLSEFAAATAPCDELLIEFGEGNNPKITQGDRFVTYEETIPEGQGIKIDTGDWSLTGVGGLTPDLSKLKHGAGTRWFELGPDSDGPKVSAVHTGTGSCSMSITGPRKYLAG